MQADMNTYKHTYVHEYRNQMCVCVLYVERRGNSEPTEENHSSGNGPRSGERTTDGGDTETRERQQEPIERK